MSKNNYSSTPRSTKRLPELRFPEFVNDNEWEEKVVSETAEYENGKAHEQDISDSGNFIVVNSKFISSDGAVKKFTNTAYCPADKNDILMVLSDVPNGKAIAKCFLVDEDNLYTVNQRVCKITPGNVNSKILFYLLNRNPYFLSFDDGVKQTNLKKEDVLSCPIFLPQNSTEQQKIADCLSSLDDLITAENQKLETLKTHKKGLMQNLFPAEDEKVPKLRFKEFEGEWKKEELGTLVDIKGRIGYRGYTINDIVNKGEGAISLSPSNIDDNNTLNFEKCTYISWGKYVESREIMLTDGYTVLVKTGSSFGKSALVKNLPEKTTINPQLVVLKPTNIDSAFLFLIVSNSSIQKQISETVVGGAIPTLSQESISKFEVLIPPDNEKKEQQKIADCLSSLDDLITTQSQKIESLKEHKKGLMQNLFPKIN